MQPWARLADKDSHRTRPHKRTLYKKSSKGIERRFVRVFVWPSSSPVESFKRIGVQTLRCDSKRARAGDECVGVEPEASFTLLPWVHNDKDQSLSLFT